MEQIFNEKLFPIAVAIEKVTGDRLADTTCWRWCLRGLLSTTGVRVRLESVKDGSRRKTSVEAVNRFRTRLNSPPAGPQHVLNVHRDKTIKEAEARLDAVGA